MEPLRVSVIIPVYNAEKYLEKAVSSALEQPETAEVILVEDASPDQALLLCEKLAVTHPEVKLYRHPGGVNRGAAASRNLGIRMARFPFIAFLDADDFFLPGRFAHASRIFENDPSVDGVYEMIGTHFYSDEAEASWLARGRELSTSVREPVEPDKLFENLAPIGGSGYFSTIGLLVRSSVFEKSGVFNEKLRMSQDTELWLRMASTAKLVAGNIETPVSMRGVHGENRINDNRKFDYYFQRLFLEYIRWALKNRISYQRINLAMGRYLAISCKINQTRWKRFLALISLIRIFPGAVKYPVVKKELLHLFNAKNSEQ